ncbi:hypothetical protein TNCV_3775201 [Trichonephila clavipes]|nr:hypothetical protein TNCV_3775201 [Trichonephila clavipes]
MLLEIYFILSDGRTRWGRRVSKSPVEEWENCSHYFTYLLMLASYESVRAFSLFQDIMPSGLTVHRVLIAPRDSILKLSRLVIQCSTWPLHHWRSSSRDSDPPVLHFTRDLLHRTTTSL